MSLVPQLVRRFEHIAETVAGAHTPLRKTAQETTQRVVWAARAELSMQALQAACMALLETDSAGLPLNVDSKTGRILIPMPWGKRGGVVWGLRSSEQRTLSLIMRSRASEPWALFEYERQAWYVANGFNQARAQTYLTRQPITLAEYRQAWAIVAPKWTSASNSAKGRAR